MHKISISLYTCVYTYIYIYVSDDMRVYNHGCMYAWRFFFILVGSLEMEVPR